MFWKKNDFDFDSISDDPMKNAMSQSPPSDPLGSPSNPTTDPFADHASASQDPLAAPSYDPSSHKPSAFGQAKAAQNANVSKRDLELLNSKLDTIKALLASLDQRVGTIEQIARAEQAKQRQEQQPKNHLW